MESSDIFITDPLSGDLPTLVEKAKAALEKKRKWYWSTVRAFVRKEGNHHTSVAPKQSWNEGFMEGATETVKNHWEDFVEKQKTLNETLQEKLTDIVQDIKDVIDGKNISSFREWKTNNGLFSDDPTMVRLPMERLRGLLEAQKRGIEQACSEHVEGLENDTR